MSKPPSLSARLRAEIAHADSYDLPVDRGLLREALAEVESAGMLREAVRQFRGTPEARIRERLNRMSDALSGLLVAVGDTIDIDADDSPLADDARDARDVLRDHIDANRAELGLPPLDRRAGKGATT